MKKLLGVFLCLSMGLVLSFGTVGCTKKEPEKAKDAKDKGKDKKDKEKAPEPSKEKPADVAKDKEKTPEPSKDKEKTLEPAKDKEKTGPDASKDKEKVPDASNEKAVEKDKSGDTPNAKAPEPLTVEPAKEDAAKPKIPSVETPPKVAPTPPKVVPPPKGASLERLSPADLRSGEMVPEFRCDSRSLALLARANLIPRA